MTTSKRTQQRARNAINAQAIADCNDDIAHYERCVARLRKAVVRIERDEVRHQHNANNTCTIVVEYSDGGSAWRTVNKETMR